MRLLVVTCCLLVSSSLFAAEATTQRFTISGGQSVELPVTPRGPLPASAEGVKVEAAGPLLGPSKTAPGKLAMIWAFSISVPKDAAYKSVSVEDVTGPEAKLVVSQDQPQPKLMTAPDGQQFNVLQLRGVPSDVSAESTAWVYQDGTSTLVFRVTLKTNADKELTLYQPNVFGAEAKSQILKMVERVSAKSK